MYIGEMMVTVGFCCCSDGISSHVHGAVNLLVLLCHAKIVISLLVQLGHGNGVFV